MSIKRELTLNLPVERAFDLFVNKLSTWWPTEYTWSQDKLETIAIVPRQGGRCFEVGPHGFTCDWGRVITIDPPHQLVITWQISPKRVPIPDSEKASEIEVRFIAQNDTTRVVFEHRHFKRHGDGHENYKAMMNSEQGWDYILEQYSNIVNTS